MNMLKATDEPDTAPLECMYCPATGPEYPIEADHPGWMCDACYQKMQNEKEREG
jgi:hypothetical protein